MDKEGLILSPIICDGMILQRDEYNRIYGTDTMAGTVTVRFYDTEYKARVDENSDFCIELPPHPAGGPYTMTIKGSSEVTISDILFGDVYILSGQSNMELPVRRVLDVSEDEIGSTCEPEIRQYLIPASYNFSRPEKHMPASSWKKAVEEDLMGFSAAGFFFAKEIRKAHKVPVGLILTAVGGSAIESWMSPSALRSFGDYEKVIEKFKDIDFFNSYISMQQGFANEWASRIEEEEYKFAGSDNYREWDTCMVPSLVSDYGKGPFTGSVYLCREVILDAEPSGDNAYIYMGAIIDSDRIWINGELVGETAYRYPPRKYRIKNGVLKKGSNLITVRIVINHKDGGTIKGKPYHLFCSGRKVNLEGEWYYKIGKRAETEMPEVLFPPGLPICFYNTVVAPLSKIAIKGVLWYQGESNTGAPEDYARKFTAMVSDWRRLFGWKVPFIYVQLHNYREPLNTAEDTGWAELRDQQRRNLALDNVAMIVTLDIGEPNDLHPQNKKEVGIRLAKAARHLIHNEPVTFSGPLPGRAYTEGRNALIDFMYLEDNGAEGSLNNFELAGPDGIFHAAAAVRKGKYVCISCGEVKTPVSVRYAWHDNPVGINFYNDAGLPAACFRLNVS